MQMVTDSTELYLPLLLDGATDEFVALFDRRAIIGDPLLGRVAGEEDIARFADETHRFLDEHEAQLLYRHTTRTPSRAVVEWILYFRVGDTEERMELPVAVVGAHHDGDGLARVRVYHSTYPLTAMRVERTPMLPEDPRLALFDVVRRYQYALAAGDVKEVMACFSPEAYVREPEGSAYEHRGSEAVRAFYGRVLAEGGLGLAHCAVTDDGVSCALEYLSARRGRSEVDPEAGLSVYERDEGGLLAAARFYHDIEPPFAG